MTDGDGGPLGAVIAGANVPDCKLLKATIEAIVVERPDPEEVEQHLCLDAGFDNPSGRRWRKAGTSAHPAPASVTRRAPAAGSRGGGWWSGH